MIRKLLNWIIGFFKKSTVSSEAAPTAAIPDNTPITLEKPTLKPEPSEVLEPILIEAADLFAQPEPVKPFTVADLPSGLTTMKTRRVRNKADLPKKEPSQKFGEWGSLSQLLDSLDGYFKSLRKLKTYDSDSYEFYKNAGAQMLNNYTPAEDFALPASWKNSGKRPAFGAIYINSKNVEGQETMLPNFMYFKKFKRLWNVRHTNHELYEVCIFYNDLSKSKNATHVGVYYVAVTNEGEVFPLKEKYGDKIYIPAKRTHYRGGATKPGGGSFTVQQWRISPWLKSLAEDYKYDDDIKKLPPEERMTELGKRNFHLIANGLENSAMAGLQVRVSKHDLSAVFYIDMLKTPDFFKDRNKTYTVNGKTKKIFHIVRTHSRKMADGTIKHIKSHFKGENVFDWNGYHVNITLPGLHHKSTLEFDAEAYEEGDDEAIGKDMVYSDKFGELIKENQLVDHKKFKNEQAA